MFFRRKDGPSLKEVRASAAFREISELAALRARLPVLRTGDIVPLWVDNGDGSEDDGVFAFARSANDGADFVVVVINASDSPRVTGAADMSLRLPSSLQTAGRILRPALTIGIGPSPTVDAIDAAAPLRLPVPPSSLVVYEPVAP
jgi:hypothetical protein